MCRIMFSKITETNKIWTRDMYRFLEKSLGGHGNGIALTDKTKHIAIVKGLNLSCQNCIDLVTKNSVNGLGLFHTRRASSGMVSSGNCQPFFIDTNRALVHNGTWLYDTDWKKMLLVSKRISVKEFMTFTDTKIIAKMIGALDDEDFLSIVDSGIFTIYNCISGKAKIYNYGGRFEVIQKKGLYYYASEFDQVYKKHWVLGVNSIIEANSEGFKILLGKIAKKVKLSTKYIGFGDSTSVGNITSSKTTVLPGREEIRDYVVNKRQDKKDKKLLNKIREKVQDCAGKYNYIMQAKHLEPSGEMKKSLELCSTQFIKNYTMWIIIDEPITLEFVKEVTNMTIEEVYAYSHLNEIDGYLILFDDTGNLLYLIESISPTGTQLSDFYANEFAMEG